MKQDSLPSVSLIIATYNWPEALELCLLSAMRQVHPPTEIVIADDGSKEATKNLLLAYAEKSSVPIRHIWQPDEGFRLATIRNKAIAGVTGDYIIQIDGDLVLHPCFIKDHLRAARAGHFIGGSRVILDRKLTQKILEHRQLQVSLLQKGVRNRLNGLRSPAISRMIGSLVKEKGLYNIRGCNISFWKKDFIAINGYNEWISGWGREDTEMIIRLYNKGFKRVYFKLQGVVYHLYHQENDRSNLAKNDEILNAALTKRLDWCEKGINQYLSQEDKA
ncbi:MAG TPA: glycosyltransferase family 2 protein [Flavitalea sp.]|nr:glycosyltransferase family 2 protein [Flavitalea sp.]